MTLLRDQPLPSQEPGIRFDSIADALAAIRNGESIVVVDDENRENEGDLICAAQFATPRRGLSESVYCRRAMSTSSVALDNGLTTTAFAEVCEGYDVRMIRSYDLGWDKIRSNASDGPILTRVDRNDEWIRYSSIFRGECNVSS